MDPLHNHLAPGAIPLVGRMFEAAAAQQLAGVRAGSALPFVGAVLACRSGASITVERRLTLDEDLFLADHNFVDAASVKPLADCFPVVPMTVSLEIMAETAACLAPGYGLTGFDDVVARRWIAVVDGGALALRVAGRVLEHDTARQTARVAVQVYAGDVRAPAIEASLSFGAEYAAEPPPQTCAVYACEQLDAARLYAQRHLFHGGRFQRLHGTVRVGPEGACAELRVLPAQDWFASQPSPQMLLDPALLDTVGQLIAVWSMQQGSAAFPIGLGRLDLFGPTPAPGTLVPASIHITGRQLKMLSADVEIGDGAGGVWLRISGWKSWQFNWARQLTAFQRQPSHFLLSDRHHLPAAPAGTVCQRLAAARVADFDLALLARHCLHPSEMAAFGAKAALPRRQQEWLLGRIVAKDAARAWSARGGAPFIHPASFAIENDGAGQPRVAAWPAALPRPCLPFRTATATPSRWRAPARPASISSRSPSATTISSPRSVAPPNGSCWPPGAGASATPGSLACGAPKKRSASGWAPASTARRNNLKRLPLPTTAVCSCATAPAASRPRSTPCATAIS